MSTAPTIVATIRKYERKYKKPRIVCPNGCGQMVSVRLNGTPHGHICGKADNDSKTVPKDVKIQCETADLADDTAAKTVPSSPASKVNSIIDAKTVHPKLKMKLMLDPDKIDVGNFEES